VRINLNCVVGIDNYILTNGKEEGSDRMFENAGLMFGSVVEGCIVISEIFWFPESIVRKKGTDRLIVDASKLLQWIRNEFEEKIAESAVLGFFHVHPQISIASNKPSEADLETMSVEKAVSSFLNLEHIHVLIIAGDSQITFKSYRYLYRGSKIRLVELRTTIES